VLLALHHSRHSWCVLLHIYCHLHFDFGDFGEGLSHAHCYLLPFCYHCQDLGYSVRTYTISFLLLHSCIYHIPIFVCYLQGYSFSTCLISFSTHITSHSHIGSPNMMYRVLLRLISRTCASACDVRVQVNTFCATQKGK
jgi:hypothetical protein